MKKLPLVLTLLLHCLFFGSFAQTPLQDTIVYDLSLHKYTARPEWIKEGSSVIFLYKGVNKFALISNASITSVNRSYDDGLSQLQAGLQQLAGEKKKAEEEKAKTDSNKSANTVRAADKPDLTKMSNYLDKKAENLGKIEAEFQKIFKEVLIVNSIMSIDKDITAATNDQALNTPALLNTIIFIQSGATGISTPQQFTSKLMETTLNIDTSLRTIGLLINELKSNFNDADLPKVQQKEEGLKLQILITELEKRANTLESTYNGQNLKTLQDNAADMARRSQKLLNQDFTVAPTVVGNADGDYIEISDKLMDNTGKQILEIKPFRIKTYGGSRIDFSVGLSVNIGGHGKYKYDLRKNPTNATSGTAVDSVILLSDDEDRLFTFSPAIFVHWYMNTKSKVQWLLTTGLTPDFTDLSNSRMSVGFSLGLPSSNMIMRRLVLSTGISIGYADVLKTKYKDLVDYRAFGDLDAKDLTEKALKVGGFFSVSYNLGGVGHQ